MTCIRHQSIRLMPHIVIEKGTYKDVYTSHLEPYSDIYAFHHDMQMRILLTQIV